MKSVSDSAKLYTKIVTFMLCMCSSSKGDKWKEGCKLGYKIMILVIFYTVIGEFTLKVIFMVTPPLSGPNNKNFSLTWKAEIHVLQPHPLKKIVDLPMIPHPFCNMSFVSRQRKIFSASSDSECSVRPAAGIHSLHLQLSALEIQSSRGFMSVLEKKCSSLKHVKPIVF